MIAKQILTDGLHSLAEPLGVQNLDVIFCIDSMDQQLLLEIERRTQVKFKDGRVLRDFGLQL